MTSFTREIVCEKVYYEINKDNGLDPYCHECTSHKSRTRYAGYIHCNRNGFQWMHKWVYWKATGETPEVVKHLCDNPVCLNLAHLKGITVEEAKSLSLPQTNARSRVNNRPPVRWGKIPEYRGSIDKEKVQQIREAIAEGQPFRQIARTLEVSLETVLAISNNQAYRSLPMSSNVVEIEN